MPSNSRQTRLFLRQFVDEPTEMNQRLSERMHFERDLTLENPTGQLIEQTKCNIVTLVNGADALVSDMHV